MAAISHAGQPRAAPRAWGTISVRWSVLIILGIYFLLPLFAMLEFSTRAPSGRTLTPWTSIASDQDVVQGITVSLELAAITVVIMLLLLIPTISWVHLRAPRARRLVEFFCLLPLAIPAIAMIDGIASVYYWVYKFLGGSALTLTFVYVILALPYAYRSIESGFGTIDAPVLADAARTLGYSWPMVILRVLVPNLRAAILSASVITVALVLGEFTIASLLNFTTLQVVINQLGQTDAQVSVAVALAALLFGFVLLLIISLFGRRNALMPMVPEEEE